MKKILIYDVAAESGGAAAVLYDYHEKYDKDQKYECYFVLSVLDIVENDRVHLIRLPWVKKSWFHRLYCDYVYMPRLIQKLQVDEVLSLQNIGVPRCSAFQTVFVQNAIPFTEHKFSLFKDSFLWIYQNVIGKMTYRSLRRADAIIVQTKWMKDKVAERCGIEKNVISVEQAGINLSEEYERSQPQIPTFFYPASPFSYKNHEVILKACEELDREGLRDYQVIFTFQEKENRSARKMAKCISAKKLPIQLVGRLDSHKMKEYYRSTIMLFPSYLETVGLPLLEAQRFLTPIIAADCAYAREAVGEYKECTFFSYDDNTALAELMKRYIMSW